MLNITLTRWLLCMIFGMIVVLRNELISGGRNNTEPCVQVADMIFVNVTW